MEIKTIDGEFTNCFNGDISIKTIEYCIVNEYKTDCKILHLINGVTGYESVSLKDINRIVRLTSLGWLACIGIKNRYDNLFIKPFDLMTLFINEGIIIVNLD